MICSLLKLVNAYIVMSGLLNGNYYQDQANKTVGVMMTYQNHEVSIINEPKYINCFKDANKLETLSNNVFKSSTNKFDHYLIFDSDTDIIKVKSKYKNHLPLILSPIKVGPEKAKLFTRNKAFASLGHNSATALPSKLVPSSPAKRLVEVSRNNLQSPSRISSNPSSASKNSLDSSKPKVSSNNPPGRNLNSHKKLIGKPNSNPNAKSFKPAIRVFKSDKPESKDVKSYKKIKPNKPAFKKGKSVIRVAKTEEKVAKPVSRVAKTEEKPVKPVSRVAKTEEKPVKPVTVVSRQNTVATRPIFGPVGLTSIVTIKPLEKKESSSDIERDNNKHHHKDDHHDEDHLDEDHHEDDHHEDDHHEDDHHEDDHHEDDHHEDDHHEDDHHNNSYRLVKETRYFNRKLQHFIQVLNEQMENSMYLQKHPEIKTSLMNLRNKILKSNDVRYKLRKVISMIGTVRRSDKLMRRMLIHHMTKIKKLNEDDD